MVWSVVTGIPPPRVGYETGGIRRDGSGVIRKGRHVVVRVGNTIEGLHMYPKGSALCIGVLIHLA